MIVCKKILRKILSCTYIMRYGIRISRYECKHPLSCFLFIGIHIGITIFLYKKELNYFVLINFLAAQKQLEVNKFTCCQMTSGKKLIKSN